MKVPEAAVALRALWSWRAQAHLAWISEFASILGNGAPPPHAMTCA